ncbi:MAG TPA: serine hydrolase domain-containing protein [Blastocatellia bacterium]|nr:serine hydrolase domain-containing protein [Blastocatellia bacterium]
MKSRAGGVLALVLSLSVAIAGQQPAADLGSQIERIVTTTLEKQHTPAMTVAVALDGRMIFSKGFGTADLENGVPATSETLIRTGSIAKSITAAAAMTLVEAGKLDLDAPIAKYCSAFPKQQGTITTRQLLTHTSGIRHYKDRAEVDSTKHYQSMSDGFAIFAADAPLFEAGTKYSYSTYGYTVVGCVIEGASGQKYWDYVREHVLLPAGMTHTFVDDLYTIVPHRARGYQFKQGKVENAGLMDSSYKIPGGGLVSTAEDLVRFGVALIDGKIVKPETLAEMWHPTGRPQLQNGRPSNYGIGFGVLAIDGQKYVTHSGGQQGTSTDMVLIPGKRFVVAVMANNEDAQPFEVTRSVLDLYHMPRPQQR